MSLVVLKYNKQLRQQYFLQPSVVSTGKCAPTNLLRIHCIFVVNLYFISIWYVNNYVILGALKCGCMSDTFHRLLTFQ